MDYYLHIAILITFYVMLAQSLALVAGYSGLISLAHAGFYGLGAYTTALLSLHFGLSFWVALPVAMLMAGAVAALVSLIALRTYEDYFIICTLGIQVILFSLMNNWMDLTRGPMGIPGIPAIQLFGYELSDKVPFLLLSLLLMSLIWWILNNLTSSPYGRVLRALSEDEICTKSLGKLVYQYKVTAFTFGAMLAAIPGVLYAHYISYIDPTSFTVNESIFILSIVIIGGMRKLWAVALAAAFLVILPELLRFVGMPNNIAANMRQIIYGLILVLVIFKQAYGKSLTLAGILSKIMPSK